MSRAPRFSPLDSQNRKVKEGMAKEAKSAISRNR